MTDNLFKSILEKWGARDKNNGFYEKGYEESFFKYRENIKLLFEIGVNKGRCLKSFKEYFPNATIVGMDINPKTKFEEDRIHVEIGNATKKDFIDTIIKKYGQPDITIDDGSHVSTQIIASYNLLYPLTKLCYVIEDIGTQYPECENGRFLNGISAMTIPHQKVDELMQNRLTSSIRFYHSICFMFKENEL